MSVPGLHFAVAKIVQRDAAFHVEPTQPGYRTFPDLMEKDGLRTIQAAIAYVREALA
ncbi:hypothetical protein [Microvirga massiliensis]|uniref:hypothetical protein n=1 Tax=Microvirga massiliensis TaxID=1033741 RepID=UPI0012B67FD1|nr:hypothetical protein [Microvirga massiliensis]